MAELQQSPGRSTKVAGSPESSTETAPGRNWKLVLAYDGTDFHGWQIQPDQPTIQGALSYAIYRITGEHLLPQGSGRTDTGVHAEGQVASFRLLAPIPPANLHRALNRALPESIRIRTAEFAPADFHARHSAVTKTYEYRIYRGDICPPFLARYVYAFNWPLDIAAMTRAAAHVIGEHDFNSFAATDPDAATRNSETPGEQDCVREIFESAWRVEDNELIYRVTGSGFLHHMVRNLVGTFLDVGRGAIPADSIPEIISARSRTAAGPTAPGRGLILVSVGYPERLAEAVLP